MSEKIVPFPESPRQKFDRQLGELQEAMNRLILEGKTNPHDERFVSLQYQRSQMTDEELRQAILACTIAECETDPVVCQTLLDEYMVRRVNSAHE